MRLRSCVRLLRNQLTRARAVDRDDTRRAIRVFMLGASCRAVRLAFGPLDSRAHRRARGAAVVHAGIGYPRSPRDRTDGGSRPPRAIPDSTNNLLSRCSSGVIGCRHRHLVAALGTRERGAIPTRGGAAACACDRRVTAVAGSRMLVARIPISYGRRAREPKTAAHDPLIMLGRSSSSCRRCCAAGDVLPSSETSRVPAVGAAWACGRYRGGEPLVPRRFWHRGGGHPRGRLVVWRWALTRALARPAPPPRQGEKGARDFGRFPGTPGVQGRTRFTYWMRDPRYSQSL